MSSISDDEKQDTTQDFDLLSDAELTAAMRDRKRKPALLRALCRVAARRLELHGEVYEERKRLVRELDVALHGEKNAAPQASLCDLIEPARKMAEENARLKLEIGRRFTVEEMNQIVTRKVAEHLRALT